MTDQTNTPELLPCPGCDCEHGEMTEVNHDCVPHLLHQVVCGVCCVSGSSATTEADAARIWNHMPRRQGETRDAARYRWLRGRDLDTVRSGGLFVGLTPDNLVLNLEDLDEAIDAAMAASTLSEGGEG